MTTVAPAPNTGAHPRRELGASAGSALRGSSTTLRAAHEVADSDPQPFEEPLAIFLAPRDVHGEFDGVRPVPMKSYECLTCKARW